MMSRTYQINPDWESLSDEIVKPNQHILVLGALDAGKTTFCQYLIDVAVNQGLKSALIDTDIGQSTIGPPTTIGMKLYHSCDDSIGKLLDGVNVSQNQIVEDVNSVTDALNADSLYYVGAISPVRNFLPVVSGTRLMVDAAQQASAEFVVIDTTGYIHEPAAVMLKQQKIDIIQPHHIVCIGRSREMEKITASYKLMDWLKIHHLPVHKMVRPKNPQRRQEHRQTKFKTYFGNSVIQNITFSDINSVRTPFFKGRIANQREVEILMQLTEEDILYAEWGHRELALIASRRLISGDINRIKDYLSLKNVTTETSSYFHQRSVGLVDKSGTTIGIGIIESVDFKNQELRIRCHTGVLSKTAMIQFGDYQHYEIPNPSD